MFWLRSVPVLSDVVLLFLIPNVVITPHDNFWVVPVLRSVSDIPTRNGSQPLHPLCSWSGYWPMYAIPSLNVTTLTCSLGGRKDRLSVCLRCYNFDVSNLSQATQAHEYNIKLDSNRLCTPSALSLHNCPAERRKKLSATLSRQQITLLLLQYSLPWDRIIAAVRAEERTTSILA